jgi:hypothetical protein
MNGLPNTVPSGFMTDMKGFPVSGIQAKNEPEGIASPSR